ncbi:MAG: hypothetical protein PHS23_08165, partial [Candidatus Cloacimonetes bacterium]|nr:hypothetical protein [Candidatus Cloacimonadota bacterium]
WSFLQENKGYILFFSAISLYIFCFSALIRNENSGDFVFYLPTYEKIVQSGSTLPNLSFLGYCYVKGFGAAHLLMAATSQYSVQYLSAACILLTCFLGARICDLLIPNKALSACFALLLLASGFMRAETYKTHALTSLLLLVFGEFGQDVPVRLHRFFGQAIRVDVQFLKGIVLGQVHVDVVVRDQEIGFQGPRQRAGGEGSELLHPLQGLVHYLGGKTALFHQVFREVSMFCHFFP